MGVAKITFYKCIQDSQDYGSDDEHMVSRVFFIFEIADKKFELHADIKQTIGSSYEAGSIEVGKPEGYRGAFNYHAFRDVAEKYYRGLVGASANGIKIQGGSNIRMRNNTFLTKMTADIEVADGSAGW